MKSICGIIGSPAIARDPEINQMIGALAYDGAQKVEGFADAVAGIALGGVATSPQAVVRWNEERTLGLLLTGEIFSLDRKDGTSIDRPRPDLLLAAYADQGARALARLNGWFAGLIIDRRLGHVVLFNDRYGLGRIYHHESRTGFYFASEAKALLTVLPQTRQVDQRGLAEFFSNGCVLQNRTLFAGLSLVPAGSAWTFHRDGRIEKNRYFDPTVWEQQATLDAGAYGEELTNVFARIVRRYLNDDRKVGISLTGGLDSRMILAWAKAVPGALPCYTFGGPYRDCSDVRIARELARVCRQPHTTLRVEADFFRDFVQLAERNVHATDGTMDVSGAMEVYMNQRARQIAPIRLTGNYGSEILRSNVAFRPGRLDRSLFAPEFIHLLDQAADTYRSEFNCRRLSFIAFKQVPWHHYSRFAAERSQLTPRSPFLDNELVALAYRAPRELEGSPQPLLELITRGNPALDTVRTDRSLRARQTPVIGQLKRQWQEFTAKAEYAYDYGMPRWLARADARLKPLHLERLFLGRHKFNHFRVWYRDQLGRVLQEGEFTRPLPCYRDGVPAQLIRQHTSGRYNWTLELHKLLTVQLIDRQFAGSSCHT